MSGWKLKNVAITASAPTAPMAPARPDWARLVTESLKQNGAWHTHAKLLEARNAYPDDLSVRGYIEKGLTPNETVVTELGADFLEPDIEVPLRTIGLRADVERVIAVVNTGRVGLGHRRQVARLPVLHCQPVE